MYTLLYHHQIKTEHFHHLQNFLSLPHHPPGPMQPQICFLSLLISFFYYRISYIRHSDMWLLYVQHVFEVNPCSFVYQSYILSVTICSPTYGHLMYFLLGAIMNKPAVTSISFCVFSFLFVKYLEVWLSSPMVSAYFIL